MDYRTTFHRLIATIAEQLLHPTDPALLIEAHAELLKLGSAPDEIVSARNKLKRREAEAEEKRRREIAEQARQDRLAQDRQELRALVADFNRALDTKNLEHAQWVFGFFRQARLQAALLQIVEGVAGRVNFRNQLREKLSNLEDRLREEAQLKAQEQATLKQEQAEERERKDRVTKALFGSSGTTAYPKRKLCREGKTARDLKNRRARKVADVVPDSKNGQAVTKAKKK